ncbi:hypothetical protein LTR97_002689 [Elasticomyces elasticus]|uniref:Uncharacterized protein n=1 Tax=Elasticomyces elasticus TaxID=574655 RepID=A0AAN7WAY7_9PEZI|nr:hypothetical protein LTR97_002689 [Elasticomyces elasticus]
MATKQSFVERLQACINTMLREEYPHVDSRQHFRRRAILMFRAMSRFTHTSDIVKVATQGAFTIAGGIIESTPVQRLIYVKRKRNRKEGVRPLQLMDLPPEIRNRIFEHVVSSHNVCSDASTTIDLQGLWRRGAPYKYAAAQPAITRVSRQLRKDTLEMFYNVNQFVIELTGLYTWDLASVGDCKASQWLEAVGRQHAAAMKNITVKYCPYELRSLNTTIDRVMADTSFRYVAGVAKLEVQ